MIVSDKRFWPLFWTQFFGALNDNVLKNALIVLITFKGIGLMGLESGSLVALAGGLFILPFIFFSPVAGQFADKFEKSWLVRKIKFWELAIMTLAAFGFTYHNYYLLFAVLLLAGMQAALFGPVKYSMLPDLVRDEELTQANAYIELGTFLAILIGTIAGGLLVSLPDGELWLTITLIGLALAGLLTGHKVLKVQTAAPDLELKYNPWPTMISTYKILKQRKSIFYSVLGISWFWFFAAAVLSILPVYVKDFLGGGEHVVTCFLAMFTIGIGVGSVLCGKLSFKRIEIGLVPLGSIGMTIFLVDLYFAQPAAMARGEALLTLSEFMRTASGARLFFDFAMMSVFGGFFILPLYTMLQKRSAEATRSRVLAGNNIMNAVFMVVASAGVIVFHALHMTYPQIFLTLAISNLLIAVWIYSIVPEFTLRFIAWMIARAVYRLKGENLHNIPATGPAILVCNHVSFVDWLIVFGLCPRPVRFVIFYKFFEVPLLKYLMMQAKVIPIAGPKEDVGILKASYDKISEALNRGEIICIFPEGQITRDGNLSPFKTGFEKILRRDAVPVIPLALRGLWGSYFSFGGGRAFLKFPRGWLSKVELRAGPPIPPDQLQAKPVRAIVQNLLEEKNV